ncbi:sugar phosphate isomerase/epimerase family protein [Actinomycetes bacterium M1A6_2h]
MSARIPIGLSTASVYPQTTESAFRFAADLGYDGVEIMVWADAVSQDVAAVAALSRKYGVLVVSLHAPCLLITQRIWGADPVAKLARSVQAAQDLDTATVVIHPPFRWQRKYADGFADQIAELEDGSDVVVAVENMFPMRADRLFGAKEGSARRLGKRGGPGPSVTAFQPSYDPTDVGHRHYTLDFSHVATAGSDAMEMAERMGDGLTHLHLADGRGASVDEHLIPGDGTVPVAEVCAALMKRGFDGRAAVEINTQNARTKAERAAMLSRALEFGRKHLS